MVLELCFLVNIFGSKGFTSPMTFCRRSNSRPGFNAVPSMASHTGITLTISVEINAGKPTAELKANEYRDSRWDFITPLSVVYPVWKRCEELLNGPHKSKSENVRNSFAPPLPVPTKPGPLIKFRVLVPPKYLMVS